MNALRTVILTIASALCVLTYIVLIVGMTGCATVKNAGLFAMSDQWCDAHPEAPSYNCSDHKDRPHANSR